MRTEIKKLRQKVRTTTVYVTHDQVEAMTLADRVVVMNAGKIDQIGSPAELYHAPRTKFVAGFIGSPAMNFVPCHLVRGAATLTVRLAGGIAFAVPTERDERYLSYVGREMIFGLRPEHIIDARPGAGPNFQEFTVQLEVAEPMGMETMVYFMVDGTEVCGRVQPRTAPEPGRPMRLHADLSHMHLIDPATDTVV
jgi:multiple sugar transport system ATP-binding protein